MKPVRVLIVDDDAAFVTALVAMLEREERIEVVGDATNGVEALSAIPRLGPDVVTMDLDMPVMDGVEATRLIARRHPAVAVIALTGSTAGERVAEAMAVGAVGHVPKQRTWTDLVPALLAAVHGTTAS